MTTCGTLTFTQMWISPVVQNIEGGTPDGYTSDGSAYHGYWINDIYKINEHFGGAQQLKNLSNALHDRGMVSENDCAPWERA